MVPIFVAVLLGVYFVWAVRKIYKDKKQRKGQCSNCPYRQAGIDRAEGGGCFLTESQEDADVRCL